MFEKRISLGSGALHCDTDGTALSGQKYSRRAVYFEGGAGNSVKPSLIAAAVAPSRIKSVHLVLLYPLLSVEQKCSTIITVKGSEFLRKVKSIAKRNKLAYRWSPERGIGSHGTVYLGERFTVVKDLKKELGPGLLADMCKQLGIRKEDL